MSDMRQYALLRAYNVHARSYSRLSFILRSFENKARFGTIEKLKATTKEWDPG